ncbi:hypothetical protein HY631_04380 [Candidatus Uhrbacteria bacterium]|nr:hypothetical protein [Candidatus Uhrbacteria bacterium]
MAESPTETMLHPPGRHASLPPVTATLPGERNLAPERLDHLAKRIRELCAGAGLSNARPLGEFLVEELFDGDEEAFYANPSGHAAFRELAKRPDVPVSGPHLAASVAVLRQLRELPADLAEALSFEHHRVLLTVRDLEKKIALARIACEEGLKCRAFRLRVRDAREPRRGMVPGRPPTPALLRIVHDIETLASKYAELARGEEAAAKALGAEGVKVLARRVDKVITTLDDANDDLGGHVGLEPGFAGRDEIRTEL